MPTKTKPKAAALAIEVDLCCNDHRNGAFSGRLSDVIFHDCETLHINLPDVRVSYDQKRIRISRRAFPINGSQEWVGNWCWNAVWMRMEDAVSLLNYLRTINGAGCEVGESRLFRKWQRGETFTREDLIRATGI